MTFMTKQLLVHEEGRPRGRLSGRKCGDVDDYLSEHGNETSYFETETIPIAGVVYIF